MKIRSSTQLVCVSLVLAAAPRDAGANITSVTVTSSRDFEGTAHYTYAEIMMSGTVARADGTTGHYSVPIDMIYPNNPGNGVGVVDWVNSAYYHFFVPTTEFGLFQFTRLATGSYLFDSGYTYASVQWNKKVTDLYGASAPNDGQAHEHLVYGTIERSADAWEIFVDAARLLKNPAAYPGPHRPFAVGTVLSSGYSQGGALQQELIIEGRDPTRAYDAHLIAMIGMQCWKRDDVPPNYGFLSPCSSIDSFPAGHPKVLKLVSETDMTVAYGAPDAYRSRNTSDPSWRQYELAGVSHLPKPMVDLVPEQNTADPRPAFRAAFANLTAWVLQGTTPPAARYFQGGLDLFGTFVPARDGDGNWLGGLRLPHLQTTLPNGQIGGAPLGVHAGVNYLRPDNLFVLLGGTFARFSDADLACRYPSRQEYVARVTRAAVQLAQDRYILPADRDAYIARAQVEPLP